MVHCTGWSFALIALPFDHRAEPVAHGGAAAPYLVSEDSYRSMRVGVESHSSELADYFLLEAVPKSVWMSRGDALVNTFVKTFCFKF